MRFSRAKPVGSFRIFQRKSNRVAEHADTQQDARKAAAFWVKASAGPFEIQERLPSGSWITVETISKPAHATRAKSAHAKSAGAIPGIAKWHTFAGGTGAAEGKYSYALLVPEGEYKIWPYTTKSGRHAGYHLKFAGTHGRPRGSHGGLWHDLGEHSSPQKAAKAARTHYEKGFE